MAHEPCEICGRTDEHWHWIDPKALKDNPIENTFEPDIDKLRVDLALERVLRAQLMTYLEVLGKLCRHRAEGKCLYSCPGMMVCDTEGLEKI